MRRLLALSLLCALITLPLSARASQEMTVFSNPGYSGAQFTVTGPRETLNIPFQARSILLREGGSWQICSANHYGGGCQTISSSTRDLNITLASARPLETAPPLVRGRKSPASMSATGPSAIPLALRNGSFSAR